MKRHVRILAGSAVLLLMNSVSGFALADAAGAAAVTKAAQSANGSMPMIFAQADEPQDGEEAAPKKKKKQDRNSEEQQGEAPKARNKRDSAAQDGGGDAGQPEQKVRKPKPEQADAQPQDEPQPKKRAPKVDGGDRPADPDAQQPKRAEKKAKQQAEGEQANPQPEKPRKPKVSTEDQAGDAPSVQPDGEAPKPKEKKAKPVQAGTNDAAPAVDDDAPVTPKPKKKEQKADEPAPADTGKAPKAAEKQDPAQPDAGAEPSGDKKPPRKEGGAEPAPKQADNPEIVQPEDSTNAPTAKKPAKKNAQDESEPNAGEQPAEQSGTLDTASPDDATAPGKKQPGQKRTEEKPNDGGEAPLLDSQKSDSRPDKPRKDGKKNLPADAEQDQAGKSPDGQPPVAEAPPGPPPSSDKDAQESAKPVRVKPLDDEKGVRTDRDPDDPRHRERPKGSEVLKEIGNRLIIQFNDQVVVESNDRPRMSRGARDVYYDDLPRGRTRETIEREDGTRVVTIRNADGDILRRSRITPDGREYVLSYVDDEDEDYLRRERRDDWRDPGDDLPPMRLEIPADEYILNADAEETPERYYDFLDQPPVERVERLYSVDEVKRSARIRDKTRRIDLDTLTFEFGSAAIPEDQIVKLQSVAEAMQKILDKNPAETFLIEGHTDAVGSDLANLALSDQRAESVADALSNSFEIPPENLTTQGYGEQYLKVRTQAPERENRRVAIRRITPLVAPVASAN